LIIVRRCKIPIATGGSVISLPRAFALAATLLTVFVSALAPAHAKRVALVVGISQYDHSPRLQNAGRDAAEIAKALRASGFIVFESLDAGVSTLLQNFEQFYGEAEGATAALFYFAGHGLQFDGVNYIVPRNAQLRSETRLKQEAIAVQDVLSAIERRAKVALVFLDACRDNPLAEALQRSSKGTSRSAAVARGFGVLDEPSGCDQGCRAVGVRLDPDGRA
jgi:uncharacterized caspase-like protein